MTGVESERCCVVIYGRSGGVIALAMCTIHDQWLLFDGVVSNTNN